MEALSDSKRPITLSFSGPVEDSLGDETIGRVEFRPAPDQGFSVWFFARGDTDPAEKVHECSEPLSWRTAARTLLDLDDVEVNTEGCSESASVSESFARPLLLTCWTRSISSDSCRAMFAFSDDDLSLLWDAARAKCAAARAADDESEHDGGERRRPRDVFLDHLSQFGEAMLYCGISAARLSDLAKLVKVDSVRPESITALLQKLASHAAFRDVRELLGRGSREYLIESDLLTKLPQYACPDDDEIAARLLYSWTAAAEKQPEDDLELNFPVNGKPAFLQWILSRDCEATLRAFAALHPSEAGDFLDWVVARRKYFAKFLASPQGNGKGDVFGRIGRAARLRDMAFCDHVLEIARGLAGS